MPSNPRQNSWRDGLALSFIRPKIFAEFADVSRVQIAVGWGVSTGMTEMKFSIALLLPDLALAEEDHLLAARKHDTEATLNRFAVQTRPFILRKAALLRRRIVWVLYASIALRASRSSQAIVLCFVLKSCPPHSPSDAI